MNFLVRFIIICFILMWTSPLEAHDSACHMWHSCPSHNESYICGGLGYCSKCPDNQYCKKRKPIKHEKQDLKTKQKPAPDPREIHLKSTPNKPERIHLKSIPKPSKNAKRGKHFVRDSVCMKWNGVPGYSLGNGKRVDCLTDKYAIGINYSDQWAELVGLALHNSMKTGKKAGIVLIMKGKNKQTHLEKLKGTIEHFRLDIKIWILESE